MEKYAVALAIVRGSELFFVRRPDTAVEYAGFWSLPTKSIPADEFKRIAVGEVMTVPYFGMVAKCVSKAHRTREAYSLHMALFVSEGPSPKLNELLGIYQEKLFLDPQTVRKDAKGGFGLCVSMAFQHLMRVGQIRAPFEYLEVPPSLANIDLNSLTDESLWKMARYGESIEDHENSDRYGASVKRATVDRFILRTLNQLPLTGVVELGAGNGHLVKEIARRGIFTMGIDVSTIEENGDNYEIICGDVYGSTRIKEFRGNCLTMNLFIQWTSDLKYLFEMVSNLSSVEYVIATWVTSEFSKHGFWQRDSSGEWVWCVQDSVSEGIELSMIDARIGPVRLYHRTIPTILRAARLAGFDLEHMEYLNFDSSASEGEKAALYSEFPDARRSRKIPQFVGALFVRRQTAATIQG